MRSAGSCVNSHFWWPLHSLGHQLQLATALHYMAPMQYITLENAAPPPTWALEALAGRQMADGDATHAPKDEAAWGWWDTSKVGVYYHGTSAAHVPSIIANGIFGSFGTGGDAMSQVYGVPVAGVYLTDRLKTAYHYPMTWAVVGPNGMKRNYYGSDVIAEDGTLPMRCVVRCIGQKDSIMWRKMDGANRQFCFLPDGVYISHIFLIAQHPHTVQEGGQLSELAPVDLDLKSMSFDAQKHMECVLD